MAFAGSRTIAFDFDGAIVDSMPVHWARWRKALDAVLGLGAGRVRDGTWRSLFGGRAGAREGFLWRTAMNGKIRGGIVIAAGLAIIILVVFGVVHVLDDGATTQRGMASWYGPGFHGKKTASGERYNQNAMTAASLTLPLGTRVMVTNLDNGKTVEVTINDRGPYVDGRIIDLSRAAARKLGVVKHGTAPVRIDVISDENASE